jgi:hypothetical protein
LKLWLADYSFELSEFLDDARRWARDEIDSLKGQVNIRQEMAANRQPASERIQSLTLQRSAETLIRGMRIRGLSQNYVDRCDKLFSNFVPEDVRSTSLGKLEPATVAERLVSSQLTDSNARVLRAFIGQIFERAGTFHGPLMSFNRELSNHYLRKKAAQYFASSPDVGSLSDQNFQSLFDRLQEEVQRWQQAFCIRLYFELDAPLSRLMSAKWAHISNGFWHPDTPDRRRAWFDRRYRISDKANGVIEMTRNYAQREFPNSRFVFPSKYGRSVGHIRTVDTMWQTALHDTGMRYYPLREVAARYRETYDWWHTRWRWMLSQI